MCVFALRTAIGRPTIVAKPGFEPAAKDEGADMFHGKPDRSDSTSSGFIDDAGPCRWDDRMKMIRKSALIALALTAFSAAAFSQTPGAIHRIGVLTMVGPLPDNSDIGAGFLRGLAAHGYVPGRNLVMVHRGAQTRLDRLPALVAELVAAKVDAIFTVGYPPALAAKQGGGTVPVVVISAGDPVEAGLVASLARPGGNVTGISEISTELSTKRLELLKELIPGLRRVAMLFNANDLAMTQRYKAAAAVAGSFGLQVQSLGVREPDDFEAAFASMTREPPDAILMVTDVLTNLNRKRVYDFAAAHRLPAIYEYRRFVHDGGLMSYGPDQSEAAAVAADLMAHILNGAKPAELPVQQPTKFELIVNLKTAKALGIAVPQSILVRADEVVE